MLCCHLTIVSRFRKLIIFTPLETNWRIVWSGEHSGPRHVNTKIKIPFRNCLCWTKDILGCFNTTISIKKRALLFPSSVLNNKLLIVNFQLNTVHFVVLKFIHQLPKTSRYLHFKLVWFCSPSQIPILPSRVFTGLYEDLPGPQLKLLSGILLWQFQWYFVEHYW